MLQSFDAAALNVFVVVNGDANIVAVCTRLLLSKIKVHDRMMNNDITLRGFEAKAYTSPGVVHVLIPFEQVPCVHLVLYIGQVVAPAVGHNQRRALLEGGQVVGDFTAEEVWVVQGGLVH